MQNQQMYLIHTKFLEINKFIHSKKSKRNKNNYTILLYLKYRKIIIHNIILLKLIKNN